MYVSENNIYFPNIIFINPKTILVNFGAIDDPNQRLFESVNGES